MEDNGQFEVKSVSPQKVEANRRNALKSTGPKTARGKGIVRLNAMKHGFFAKEVDYLIAYLRERPSEFKSLHNQLRETLQPVGKLEELLVEKIALCFWRSRRALRCEIAQSRHGAYLAQRQVERTDEYPPLVDAAIRAVKRAREDIETNGILSEATREEIEYWLPKYSNRMEPFRHGSPMSPEQKEASLRAIDQTLSGLEQKHAYLRDALQLQEISLTLPPGKDLERILRYEASNERQLNRALAQLERLQRQRKGEDVPPPVTFSGDLGPQ